MGQVCTNVLLVGGCTTCCHVQKNTSIDLGNQLLSDPARSCKGLHVFSIKSGLSMITSYHLVICHHHHRLYPQLTSGEGLAEKTGSPSRGLTCNQKKQHQKIRNTTCMDCGIYNRTCREQLNFFSFHLGV